MTRSETIGVVGQLFEEWYSPLVRYAWRQIRSVESAEDVVQDAFLSLSSQLMQDHPIDNPKAWLFCVVRREVIRRHRESARHGGAFVPLTGDEPTCNVADSPLDHPSYHDDLTTLMAELSAREEEVIVLRVKGLKYREIASALDITTGSVKTLIARALVKLQSAASNAAFGKRPGYGNQNTR